jgi:hypothetical protein
MVYLLVFLFAFLGCEKKTVYKYEEDQSNTIIERGFQGQLKSYERIGNGLEGWTIGFSLRDTRPPRVTVVLVRKDGSADWFEPNWRRSIEGNRLVVYILDDFIGLSNYKYWIIIRGPVTICESCELSTPANEIQL